MSNRNPFGLSRYIPADVALEIRRRSKFGCVVCRSAVYQYEHIDPEFADAEEHSPEHICLLCGGCHDRVTRGRLSKESILDHYNKIQLEENADKASEKLDFSEKNLTIEIGTARFETPTSVIQINGENILALAPPEEGGKVPRLSGIFYDSNGNESFRISENVWEGPIEAWDIETIGQRTTIKCERERIAVSFEVNPPREIKLLHLDMLKDNCRIICNNDQLMVGQTVKGVEAFIGIGNFICMMPKVAISVDSRSNVTPRITAVKLVGGEGIFLEGTGIRLGVGSISMGVSDLMVWEQ